MCGILGALALRPDARPVEPAAFEALIDLLAHRGPDGRGVLRRDRLWLGHRRLSILDPSPAGRQPMTDLTGVHHIAYNGEVFNYVALRDELRWAGHAFVTDTDTEVVLNAYRAWGLAALPRLYGIFAFGLYDAARQQLHLVRDRFGVKPLYWAEIEGHLVFSSELKGVLNFPGYERRLDPEAVSAYLSLRYAAGRRTYFAGIRALLPGHVLTCDDAGIRERPWWSLPERRSRRLPRPAERRRMKRAVGRAILRNTVSDVPVGAYLSGGLDSSIIVHEMSRRAQAPPLTFTASFADRAFDEARHAAVVASACGAAQHLVTVTPESYLHGMRELIRYKDQPLGMHNEVALYLLARRASEQVKVVLSGEGADEAFAGYGRIFRTPFDWRRLWLARRLPRPLRAWAMRRTELAPEAGRQSAFELFFHRYTYFPDAEKAGLLTAEARRGLAGDARVRRLLRTPFDAVPRASLHDRIARTFALVHLPGLLLMMDATGMAAGVEVRVPFVEHDLFQRALALPVRSKLRWRSPAAAVRALLQPVARFSETADETKSALRRAYAHELPASVARRRKVVFSVPLNDWFRGPLGAELRRLLLAEDARCRCLLDREGIERWLREHDDGSDARFGRKAWLLLSLELFLREYFDEEIAVAWPSSD